MQYILLLILIIPLFSTAQIKTKTIGSNEVIDYSKKIPYDGKQNNVEKHFMKYLNEELYLPCSIYESNYGYRKEAFALGDKNRENKYYQVIKIRKPIGEMAILYEAEFILVEKEKKDTVVYNYQLTDFPFITIKHFNYVKSKYLNKQQIFTYKDIVVNDDFKFEDYKTKKEVPIFEKKLFTIIDIFIVTDKDCGIYMVLKSGNTTLLHRHECNLEQYQ